MSLSYESVNIMSVLILWDKVFKNGPSKLCGTLPSKNLPLQIF